MSIKYLNTAPFMCAPDDGGGGGGAAAAALAQQQQGTGGAPAVSAPPWGADPNQVYTVGDKPWYDHLPDSPTKALLQEKKYANPQVLADAYYSANRMINGNSVEVPAADASPEAYKAFHQKIGALDDPKKYDIKVPDGVQADPKLIGFMQEAAAEYGLTPRQAQSLADKWNKTVPTWNTEAEAATKTQQATANAAELESIKTKWGGEFDSKLEAGKRVASSIFDLNKPEEKALMGKIESSIGAAAMLELFARIGSKSGEGTFDGSGGGNNDNTNNMTPEVANGEINRLRGDAEFMKQYGDANHPQHQVALKRMEALYARMKVRA